MNKNHDCHHNGHDGAPAQGSVEPYGPGHPRSNFPPFPCLKPGCRFWNWIKVRGYKKGARAQLDSG